MILARLVSPLLECEAVVTSAADRASLARLLNLPAVGDGDDAEPPGEAEIRAGFETRTTGALAALDELAQAGEHPLAAVAASCGLSTDEARVLGVCAAIEADERLQLLLAHALDAPGARRPTVALLVRMLGAQILAVLSPNGRLRRAELLEVAGDDALAAAVVGLPRTVVWSLLGDTTLDPGLPTGAHVVTCAADLLGAYEVVLVHGTDPVRRLQAGIAAGWGLGFLVVDDSQDEESWRMVVRQAGLLGLGLMVEVDAALSSLVRFWVERADHLTWVLSSVARLALEGLPRRDWHEVAAAAPEVSAQEWAGTLTTAPGGRRLTAHQLSLVAESLPHLPDEATVLHRLADGPLTAAMRRVEPRVGWDDLVLPDRLRRRLVELAVRYRHRSTVHDTWGLARFPSPGLVTLLTGPSGTGKTMSAEVIAGELGVDLLRVDLPSVLSKYIGETEKNLDAVFSAAGSGDSVLLFDEADALFGTRGKVTDARDRYANMEVSFLLQRLETYEGFVILTSNLQGNIDPAFLRRVHATVHFMLPGPDERQAIWQRTLAATPIDDDVDLGRVAKNFDLSGGSIRNAALAAAFLAAPHGSLRSRDLARALADELGKLGRRPTVEMFGPWYDYIAEAGAYRGRLDVALTDPARTEPTRRRSDLTTLPWRLGGGPVHVRACGRMDA